MASPSIGHVPSAVPDAGASAPAGSQRRRGAPVVPAPVPPPTAAAGNPSLRLDPGLGLVVIEFHNTAGAVIGTIPTEQQLQAYRRWQDARVGPADQADAAAPAASVPRPIPTRPSSTTAAPPTPPGTAPPSGPARRGGPGG